MCVDLQDKTLVSSSNFNGQKKQFDKYTGLTLMKGYAFVLKIIITDSEFQIVINEELFATYPNHLTFDAFKYVQVFGNVDINWILFSILNPVSPVKIERRPGGEKIVVYGYPTNDTTEFSVNVHCLPDCDEEDNFIIVTHVNIRFNHFGILKRVVLNHFQNGVWARESIYDAFNFKLGYQFKLQLLTNPGYTWILIDDYFKNTWYHGMNCYNRLGFYREVKVEKILMS
ncbi:uncharacterized protein LOC131937303 [Physella acuta]|uniref:uncharacterized protein LOC131937303 n=1 Tax=Physella acuta TaxID=109671 RepID=UPI0027DCF2B8|nr:uncharacterized protein LOC131937303 [Physella acuta]